MNKNESLMTGQNIATKQLVSEDICYASEDIMADLKQWEYKAGFSKEISPKPGPYIHITPEPDYPSEPWSHSTWPGRCKD
ncbi:hypothetical protein [Labilibaculum euxinus]